MSFLARRAVAVFGIQRLFPTELVMNFPAVTASFITCVEVRIVCVDPIRGAEFPLIMLTLQGTVIPVVSILTVNIRCHCSRLSLAGTNMRMELERERDEWILKRRWEHGPSRPSYENREE